MFKVEVNDYSTSENVDGILLVIKRACFFVPDGRCDYLDHDNSESGMAKAVLVDYLINKNEIVNKNGIKSLNPTVANIEMLPNKDSSNVIVWLERNHFYDIDESECYIIPAKVLLTTKSQRVEYFSFSYNLRFNWQNVIYNYECIYKGCDVYCNIISQKENLNNRIFNTQSLPIGKELEVYR
jgi:hypothetical protein